MKYIKSMGGRGGERERERERENMTTLFYSAQYVARAYHKHVIKQQKIYVLKRVLIS